MDGHEVKELQTADLHMEITKTQCAGINHGIMELQKIMTTTEAFEMMFIVLKLSCTVSGIIKCKDSWEKDLQGPNLDICVKD